MVNINSADSSQLTLLPRVGQSLAQRIVDYRKENGPFKQTEDLMLVGGIGEKMFEVLKPYVTLSGETTLDEKPHGSRSGSRAKCARIRVGLQGRRKGAGRKALSRRRQAVLQAACKSAPRSRREIGFRTAARAVPQKVPLKAPGGTVVAVIAVVAPAPRGFLRDPHALLSPSGFSSPS